MNTKWILAPQLITIQIIVAILLFITSRILYLRMKKLQRELDAEATHLDFGVMHAYGILFALTFMLGCSTIYAIVITIQNGL